MATKQTFLKQLFDAYGAPLVRFLTNRVRDEEEASDLAQEAFLRIYNLEHPQKLTNARAFLFQTASNLVIDRARREKVHARFLESESASPDDSDKSVYLSPSAERTVAAEQQLRVIYRTIDHLPPNCRHAFLLHRGRNMTYSEIAKELGISTSMVEKYVIEALKACRQALLDSGEDA